MAIKTSVSVIFHTPPSQPSPYTYIHCAFYTLHFPVHPSQAPNSNLHHSTPTSSVSLSPSPITPANYLPSHLQSFFIIILPTFLHLSTLFLPALSTYPCFILISKFSNLSHTACTHILPSKTILTVIQLSVFCFYLSPS